MNSDESSFSSTFKGRNNLCELSAKQPSEFSNWGTNLKHCQDAQLTIYKPLCFIQILSTDVLKQHRGIPIMLFKLCNTILSTQKSQLFHSCCLAHILSSEEHRHTECILTTPGSHWTQQEAQQSEETTWPCLNLKLCQPIQWGNTKKKSLLYFKHTQRVMHITTKSRKPLYLISKWDCIALWALLHLGKRSRGIEAFAPFRFDDSYSISFSSCHCSHKLCSIPGDITMTLSLFPQWSSLCVHPPGHINLTKCQVSSKLFCFLFPSSKLLHFSLQNKQSRNSLWNKP